MIVLKIGSLIRDYTKRIYIFGLRHNKVLQEVKNISGFLGATA